MGKLYVNNRGQAVVRGKKLGLLTPTEKEPTDPVSKLPSFPSPFIGRLDELNTIKRQLKRTRLLTISGPGGVGKTRLAIQTAMETTANFKHGSFLVSLAPISSSDKIAQIIAEALVFPLATAEDPRYQLIRYLQKKQLLLVLDNFEHLLEGTPILEQILQAAPKVKVLLTSRERLNLQGEMNYQIRGMAMPDSGEVENILSFDAISLFIQTVDSGHTSIPQRMI